MASRRSSNKSTDTTPTDTTTNPTESPEEETMSTDTDTTPETTDETVTDQPTTETPEAGEAKPEATFDLTDFKAAAEEAVESADESTGEIPEAGISKLNAAYRGVEGLKGKNAARTFLNDQMKAAMDDSDIVKARAYMNLGENLSAGSSGGSSTPRERTPIDPTEGYVERLVTLKLAVNLVPEPEGLAEDWQDKANELYGKVDDEAKQYVAWLEANPEDRGDEPEVTDTAKAAAKLALGRSAKAGSKPQRASANGTTYSGPRRNILGHIKEAFADKESGTFLKISEIRAHVSSEYGDDHPSAGAISARLFPKSGNVAEAVANEAGVEPAERDGSKGAVKL